MPDEAQDRTPEQAPDRTRDRTRDRASAGAREAEPAGEAGAGGAGARTAPPAVRVEGLWKRFGGQIAVAGIDLELPAGRFVGLVGPNGAGKTTTLSMVTGLLRPDQGRVLVAGHDVWRDPVEVKARIGVLPEGLRLFERLSGRELLGYTGRLRGLPGTEVDKRATQLLDVLDLAGAQHKLVVDYSTGMRKKIGLAAALLGAMLATGAVASARFPYSIPQGSGYKNVAPGQASLAWISIFGGMLGAALLCAPVIGLTVWLHLSGADDRSWILLPLGTVYGALVAAGGLRLAAPQTATRLPEILAAVSKG
nr:ABC transporter ATP-binding protein [Streptomyces sp. NBC_00857]